LKKSEEKKRGRGKTIVSDICNGRSKDNKYEWERWGIEGEWKWEGWEEEWGEEE